jgi:quercetin dioxygenase-like cupin family protein
MTEQSRRPQSIPRSDWSPLPRPGCVNVEGKVLHRGAGLALAMLRFQPDGCIDEHSADFDIEVICLEGCGFISIESDVSEFKANQSLLWSRGNLHKLWTTTSAMTTLMVEMSSQKECLVDETG